MNAGDACKTFFRHRGIRLCLQMFPSTNMRGLESLEQYKRRLCLDRYDCAPLRDENDGFQHYFCTLQF
jgi:hypothetical protein